MFDLENGGMNIRRNAHPADVIPQVFASANFEANANGMKNLELWYVEYQNRRKSGVLYKSCKSMVRGSILLLTN